MKREVQIHETEEGSQVAPGPELGEKEVSIDAVTYAARIVRQQVEEAVTEICMVSEWLEAPSLVPTFSCCSQSLLGPPLPFVVKALHWQGCF